MTEAIGPDKWKWYGTAAHLIVGEDCRFHLATEVGKYMVSTVGQWLPDEGARDIMAEIAKVELQGRGDERRRDYMNKVGYKEIGFQRKFETMVFRLGKGRCKAKDCNCGLPTVLNWSELDSAGYNSAGDATRGHYAMCRKWAKKS